MANDILNIHCPSCGAPAEYDIVEQSYLCGHCGGRVKIEEALSQKAKYLETQRKRIKASAGSYPLRSSTCTGCGASVVFAESDAVTSCAFCGRSLVRQEYNYDGNIPESIIPFAVTKEEAEKRLLDWCDANPKKPEATELRKCTSLLQGCYLPYEMARGPVSGYVYHPKATQNFEFDGFVNEEFVNVSKGLDNLLLDATEPYDTSALVPFDFAYVAGQVVKIKDIEDDNAEKRLKNEISSNYKPGFEKIWKAKDINVHSTVESSVRLPVLLPAYYINNGKVKAAVNGQTGKVSVMAMKDKHYIVLPWWIKALAVLLAALGLTFGALLLGGTTRADALPITGMLGLFYMIVYLCMLGNFSEKGSVGHYRMIYNSGEETFRREKGKLIPRDEVLERKISAPVFKKELDGVVRRVSYVFKSPLRLLQTALITVVAVFLPVICALFINGFDFARLELGGSAVWFCIAVPVVPVYLCVYAINGMYESPWIYTIDEKGRKRRYRKKSTKTAKDVMKDILACLKLLIAFPLALAIWGVIIAFCVMVYLTAFGF